MSELNIKIIELINEGKNINEIEEILKIGPKRLMLQLKKIVTEGYELTKNVDCNGNINLSFKKDLENNKLFINLEENKCLRTLFISDLHLGRKKDKLDYLDDIYNYAIKNNIKIIFNLGDMVENVYRLSENELLKKTIEEQIEYVIKNYPYDKNIVNLVLYGNHDCYSLLHSGLNIGKVIENERYDLISLGYNNSNVYFKQNKSIKDYIRLLHEDNNYNNSINGLTFAGHSHKYRTDFIKEQQNKTIKAIIKVPSLCDEYPDNYDYKPLKGFLDVTFNLKNSLINDIFIKQQIIHYGIHQASECKIKVR